MTARREKQLRTWVVEWSTDLDPEDATSPYDAAERVWLDSFGRTVDPTDEEACVFTVTSPEGEVFGVDLSQPDEAVVPAGQMPATQVLIEMPSGYTEAFSMPDGVEVSREGDALVLRPRRRP